MVEIYLNCMLKNSKKSVRFLSDKLGIPISSFLKGQLGYGVRYEHQLTLKQYLDRTRLTPKVEDASIYLPEGADLHYRYAAMDENGAWHLFNSRLPPVYKRNAWFDQIDGVPLAVEGVFKPVPQDEGPPQESIYQRDLETSLWVKIHHPYNARMYSGEDVAQAERHPKKLSIQDRMNKANLYRGKTDET